MSRPVLALTVGVIATAILIVVIGDGGAQRGGGAGTGQVRGGAEGFARGRGGTTHDWRSLSSPKAESASWLWSCRPEGQPAHAARTAGEPATHDGDGEVVGVLRVHVGGAGGLRHGGWWSCSALLGDFSEGGGWESPGRGVERARGSAAGVSGREDGPAAAQRMLIFRTTSQPGGKTTEAAPCRQRTEGSSSGG